MKKISLGLFSILISVFLVACGAGDDQGADDSSGEDSNAQSEEQSSDGSQTESEDGADENSDTTEESTDSSDPSTDQQSGQVGSHSEENIVDYELQIDLVEEQEYDYSYDTRNNEYEIEIGNGSEQELSGEQAKPDLEELLEFVHVDQSTPLNEMVEATLSHLEIDTRNLSEYEVETRYDDGLQLGIGHQGPMSPGNAQVNEFDLSLTFNDGNEWEYDYDRDGEVEIEKDNGDSSEDARQEIESLLENIDISAERSFEEMVTEVFEQLEVNEEDIEEFELDIQYDSDEQIQLSYDTTEDNDD